MDVNLLQMIQNMNMQAKSNKCTMESKQNANARHVGLWFISTMAHKYLNKIGIESDNPCVFNTENTKNIKRYKKERKKYGFDTRETWSMDFTSATWLYEHLKVFKKANICDLEYHKFNIPVLYGLAKSEIDENDPYRRYTKEVIEEHTQGEAIDLMIRYLEQYLYEYFKKSDTSANMFDEDIKRAEYLQCAFKIYSEVICAMWW